ncbi:uncharacterized protein [Mytilus edulis]|uniref:uncharacterized protein n=1 Tax=Mytilus edulis TaxID=6550 RepID=UPI0039EE248F
MARNTSRQGVVIAAVVIGILIIVGILVAVCIFRRQTAHNNNMKTEPEIISEQYEVPNEHQNGGQNNAILNLPYEIASSIGYSHGLTSAAPDSNAEQYKLQKEHTNGGKNKAILSSPYDMASSIEYSFEMTSAKPDSIDEQYELPKEHTNEGKNNTMVNSPYEEIASSIEYVYAITKSEPDSICVKNTGGYNEHLHVKGKGTKGKLSFDIENPKSSTYSHLRDADGGSDITYDHTSHGRVQRTPEGDYDVSCNRITEDEYNISDNYNVSFSKDSDYNQF